MTPKGWTYIIFGIVIVVALIFDLGLFSKKNEVVTIRKALYLTAFWVGLSLLFFGFIWLEDSHSNAISYLSAYLMEWSLSIDNIFLFILIFNFFKVKDTHYARVLLWGILIALVLRALFITIGVGLVSRFHWILYIFGAFLVYTGIKMFFSNEDEEYDPQDSHFYKLLRTIIPFTDEDPQGKLILKKDNKTYFTSLSLVIIILAGTDLVFALDSIPAVFAISQKPMVIYTSNIFAVLGLRSLFFLLQGAVNKFQYLQQGIAVVLVLIGLKMLVEIFHVDLPVYVSLLMIVTCIGGSILLSLYKKQEKQ